MRIHHPPGRAGRLWLIERLGIARQAADLLERKRHALRREERRLGHLADETATAFARAARDAEVWQQRAMILGGRSALESAARAAQPADARLAWSVEMGVHFAAEASCRLAPFPAIPGTPALVAAAREYRRTLQRAVEHAAAIAALQQFRRELTTTEQRLHAVRDRWIPALEEALDDLELRLDEQEREELVRTRLNRRNSLPGAS